MLVVLYQDNSLVSPFPPIPMHASYCPFSSAFLRVCELSPFREASSGRFL